MAKRYREIVEHVQKQIEAARWPVGYKLPREVDLCREFDVSRTTIRKALSLLVAQGHLRRIKGTGTFVTQPQMFDKTTIFVESFAEELKARGLSSVTEVLEFRMLPEAGDTVGAALNIPPCEPVLKVRRLRYAVGHFDTGPIVLTTSYYPKDIGEIVQRYDLERTSIQQLFQANKIYRARGEKRISATRLSQKDCRLLGAGEDDLFLSIFTRFWNESGRLVEYSESYYPVDRNIFSINITSA